MIGSSRGWSAILGGLLLSPLASGCAHHHDQLRQALQKPQAAPPAATDYAVACPDVVLIQVDGRADLSGQREVQANGCVALGALGGMQAAGLTPADIEGEVARLVGVSPARVRVHVEQHLSKQVYLFGEVSGLQRAVHYQGPEKVVDLLRRTGGITPEGAPEVIRIVRNPNLANHEPETIRVDLRAILLEGDDRTNVMVQPYDQIYVDESKEARLGKCLHPWLRPFCRLMTGGS